MLIHLVEPMASGHRLMFVRRIAAAARAGGHRVLLSTCRSSLDHPAFRELAALVEPIEIADGDAHVEKLSAQRGPWALLGWHALIARHWRALDETRRGDVAVLPYADYCLLACGVRGSPFAATPWIGITMQPTFHHAAVGIDAPRTRGSSVSAWLFGRAVREPHLHLLFALDETLPTWADARWPKLRGRCAHLGDPADPLPAVDRNQARLRFVLPANGRVLLVFGAINPRKGLRELAAATALPTWPADLIVLVVGAWDDAAQTLATDTVVAAARACGRLLVHDQWADAATEAAAFAAADIVWMGYVDFFRSSGVLMQAALARLPVVACRSGLIGWLTTRHQLGPVVDPRDAAAVAAAMQTAARGPAAESFRPPTGQDMGERVVAACLKAAA